MREQEHCAKHTEDVLCEMLSDFSKLSGALTKIYVFCASQADKDSLMAHLPHPASILCRYAYRMYPATIEHFRQLQHRLSVEFRFGPTKKVE